MICPFCLDFIPNTCTVCPSCGERVSAFSEADLHCSHDGAPVRPGFTPLSPTTPSRRKRSTPMLTIVLTLLVLVGRLGIALIFSLSSEPRSTNITPAFSAVADFDDAAPSSRPAPQPDSADAPVGSATAYLRADEIFPDFSSYYYLNKLSTEELNVACLLYEAAMRFDLECAMPEHVSVDTLSNIFYLLELDCPELLQVDFGMPVRYTTGYLTGDVITVTLPYRMKHAEYQKATNACLAVIDELRKGSVGLSALEREYLVFDYLTTTCTYDMEIRHAENAYGALVNGRAKCDGVAYAVTWALRELDVPCLSVAGYPSDGSIGHAWNLVELDGTYYTLDVTANLYEDGEEPLTLHLYCNVPNKLLLRTYPVVDECIVWCGGLPEADAADMNYYALNGLYVAAGADYSELLDTLFSEAYYRTGYLSLQFEDEDDLSTLCSTLIDSLDGWQYANNVESLYYSYVPIYEEDSNIFYMTLEPDTDVQLADAA